ncbi:MAG: ATPase, partial [Gammaproteobacteria bacterium]|nr:ATPase [Gammaproteobacteria bacterium]
DIIYLNPFFQRKTKRMPGCQIDLLIQTKSNCLYICEIKFSKSKLTTSVIDEVKQKVLKVKMPRNYSCRTVLIHANTISDAIIEENYFSHIIDFSDLLCE